VEVLPVPARLDAGRVAVAGTGRAWEVLAVVVCRVRPLQRRGHGTGHVPRPSPGRV